MKEITLAQLSEVLRHLSKINLHVAVRQQYSVRVRVALTVDFFSTNRSTILDHDQQLTIKDPFIDLEFRLTPCASGYQWECTEPLVVKN